MNLAPLIDVVFLLLIFFMVASSLDADKEIQATIQIPQVDTGQTRNTNRDIFIIYLDKNGMIQIEGKYISWDELPVYLEENPVEFSEAIQVYADKEVHFEYIARLMSIAHRANREHINFLLEKID